jgi:hypothetical protein
MGPRPERSAAAFDLTPRLPSRRRRRSGSRRLRIAASRPWPRARLGRAPNLDGSGSGMVEARLETTIVRRRLPDYDCIDQTPGDLRPGVRSIGAGPAGVSSPGKWFLGAWFRWVRAQSSVRLPLGAEKTPRHRRARVRFGCNRLGHNRSGRGAELGRVSADGGLARSVAGMAIRLRPPRENEFMFGIGTAASLIAGGRPHRIETGLGVA